jgi:hypothetical protein
VALRVEARRLTRCRDRSESESSRSATSRPNSTDGCREWPPARTGNPRTGLISRDRWASAGSSY